MILHLIFDDKFADYAIKQFMPYGDSEFVLVKSSANEKIKFIKQQDHLTIYLYGSDLYKHFLESLPIFRAIIIHGFYTYWQVDIVCHAPDNLKVCWAFWGGDKYQRADICDSYLSYASRLLVKVHRFITRKSNKSGYEVPMDVLRRVDYLLDDSYENFEDVRNYINKPELKHLWYSYYSIEETIGHELMNSRVIGNNLLIGHNAGIRTNHIDGFLAANRLDLKAHNVISVLAYGEPWYRNFILRLGKWLFGKQFHAQVDFVPRDQYNKLLRSCPAVLFPTYKPEAMGNCLTALWMGARLYMYKCNLQYQYFVRLGLKLFTIEDDFQRSNSKVFEPLSQEDMLHNQEILMREYGFNEMDVKIKQLIEELEK